MNLILFSTIGLFAQSTNTVPKQGGIAFRVDDNGLIDQFDDYSDLFNSYGQKFTFAMNLGFNEFDSQEYINKIISYQNMGHELMDHTPDHRTNYFITKFDPIVYSNEIGVDHIIDDKICLAHENPDLQLFAHTSIASIKNNEIEFSSSDFSDIVQYDERYIYIVELESLFLVSEYHNKKATITDIWDEEITLDNQSGITYYTFDQENINLTPDAIFILANETKKLAELYGLKPDLIKTFIQPGGNFVDFHSYEIKTPMGSLGYTSGATYPDKAEKVYNEYNPDNERQFAMQWGDFVETDYELEFIKSTIAEESAKHKLLIGNSHWYSDDPNEWSDFINKNDALLNWATSNDIPIKTYFEWSDLLYNQTPDPYYNIIPSLNMDKDENGIPDGYTQFEYPGQNNSTFVIDNTTPGPGKNYYSIETSEVDNNRITYILGLGGFEKGENDFSIWTKGAPGDSVEVVISEPWPSDVSISFKFPADTPDWEKHSLGGQGKSFIVNENQSVLDVDFYCSDYVSGTVKIAGMSLTKKVEIASLELNIISSLPSLAGDSILVEIVALDEFGNPHENYFNYFLETSENSFAEILSSSNGSFNGYGRDTIIVTDTVAENFNLTAKLVHDNLVSGSTKISIKHRAVKYLDVLSSSDSITIGDSRLLQVVLKDTFNNIIPDSLVTFEALNGNGKFSNNLQTIATLTDTIGIAEDLYTASASTNNSFDSIKVHYENTIVDTIILSLKAAPISNLTLTLLATIPALAGDSIQIEVTAKDIFGNEVVSSSNYKMKVNGSSSAEYIPTNIISFNNSAKDTVTVRDTVAGSFFAIAQLVSDTTIVDSILIETIHNSPNHLIVLSSSDSISVGSSRNLKVKLEDVYNNIIPDSLVTFEVLNGNGKFSNNLQTIATSTDTIGVAEVLYSTSTILSYLADTIKVHYNNTIIDTIVLPLMAGEISQFELATLGSLPAYEADSILVEITAKDIFGNEVISSSQYEMSADSSITAKFLPSNIYSFSNSSKDTLIVIDSIAGSFNVIAQLQSDTLVVDSILIDVVYSPKDLSIKMFIEGAYLSSSKMKTEINSYIPIEQPYNIAPWNYSGNETVTNISEDIVDWVLVTLREDIDPNNHDPNTATDVVTQAALLTKDGFVMGLNGLDPISFSVKLGEYYLVIQHRNHIEIMSKTTIELKK